MWLIMENARVLKKIKELESLTAQKLFSCNSDFRRNIESLPRPTPTQMRIMEYILSKNDQDIYQKDLEDVLGIKRATVSGVLQTMEKNGLIERVIDENDTRTKKIILKKETREIFEKQKKKFEIIEKELTKNISEDEIQTFFNIIDKMEKNLK